MPEELDPMKSLFEKRHDTIGDVCISNFVVGVVVLVVAICLLFSLPSSLLGGFGAAAATEPIEGGCCY